MAVETPTVLKTYFQTGDKPTQGQFVNLIDSAIPALVYRALITQAGIAAPTAIILQNTLGEVPALTFLDTGKCNIGTTGIVFTPNKTFLSYEAFQGMTDAADPIRTIALKWMDDQNIRIITTLFDTGSFLFVPANDVLSATSIEITVYP